LALRAVHFGKSIGTISEFSRERSNTICFPATKPDRGEGKVSVFLRQPLIEVGETK
jgi:hypothetical protein